MAIRFPRLLTRLMVFLTGRRPRGRHRVGQPVRRRPTPGAVVVSVLSAGDQPTIDLGFPDAGLPALVRPYVYAHEQREERWARRRRRAELWLAVHGVDAGPRRIHGWVVPR